MNKRFLVAALGAAALALPATAAAGGNGHAKGPDKAAKHERAAKKDKKAKKDKGSKAKKAVSYVFKGVYKGDGVVTVAKGNAHVRKGGYVGKDVTFDLSAAKLVVADTDGVPGITLADVQAGDKVVVHAKQARGTKAPVEETETEETTEAEASGDDAAEVEAPAAIKARKLVDQTHPPVEEAEEAEAPEAA